MSGRLGQSENRGADLPVSELKRQVIETDPGRPLADMVRRHPEATVGLALATGFVLGAVPSAARLAAAAGWMAARLLRDAVTAELASK